MLSSSWPAASEGWRSHKRFQQRPGQQSTPSNLWPVIWLGVSPINTPCWQAGVFQLFDCWSDRWSAWVCKEMMLLLLINTYSNSCWGTCSPEQGGSSTDSHLYLTSGTQQKISDFQRSTSACSRQKDHVAAEIAAPFRPTFDERNEWSGGGTRPQTACVCVRLTQ